MSLLASAASLLHVAVSSIAGETVTYSRAGIGTVTIKNAVPSKPEMAVEDQIAARIRAESLDWTVLAASIVITGVVVQPVQGDTITRGDGSIYELESPPYRLSDSAGVRLRLYTKRVT